MYRSKTIWHRDIDIYYIACFIMKKYIVLFLLLYCFNIIWCQNISFRKYEVEDGLSHNSVLSIIQDEKGFMWFGTKDGLNRFDGYNFKLYKTESNDGLSSNFIRCLHQYAGYIWVGTDNGLYQYDTREESFKIVQSTKDKPILDIKNDQDGNLWFITAGTLCKYNVKGDLKGILESYDQFYASFLTQSNQGEIWIASSNNLFKYLKDNNSFNKIELNTSDINPGPTVITEVFAKGKDSILLGTKDHGALVYNNKNDQLSSLLPKMLNPLYVRGFMVNSKDELWVATESGIYTYNNDQKTYELHEKRYNDPNSLSDNAIYSMVKDREGGIWVGTYFGGINYFAKPYIPIQKYFPKTGENSISGNAVREIVKDKFGDLWIGTEDAGLNKLSPSDGLFRNYSSKTRGGTLSHSNIHGLLPIDDKLWIGTFEHGIDVMDIKTGKILKRYSISKNKGLRSDFILNFYQTKDGELFILTSSGIHRYDQQNDQFIVVNQFPAVHHYTSFLQDSKGRFWAGTYWDGLFYFDPKTKKKGVYRADETHNKSIGSNTINGIFEDSKNNIWVTTENGLSRFDYQYDNFKTYTSQDGLSSNVTYAILEDTEQNLWISTSNGLTQLNLADSTKTIYSKADGLLSEQFNYSSGYKDKDGTMYFGSVKGMIKFNPKDFKKDTLKPEILLTGLQVNNNEPNHYGNDALLSKSITYANKLELENSQSSLNIEFAALHYSNPEMVNYWYQLEGISEDWIPVGRKHQISFIELPYGDYKFKVKAQTSKGAWSNTSEALAITILPPFSRSTLAYVLYCLTVGLLFFLGLKYYHTRNKEKNKRHLRQLETLKEKELYQAKIDFFNNITHEIRTPLTLIKSPLEKLLKTTYQLPDVQQNLSIMEKNTDRLLNLVNQLLDFRKTEIEQLKLNFVEVNISQLVRDIIWRFSPLLEPKNITLTLQINDSAIQAYINEEAFQKIVSNLFSNAIKYTAGKIVLKLSAEENGFVIELKNDGFLIPTHLHKKIFDPFFRVSEIENKPGTGIGLSLASSLVDLHDGELYMEIREQLNCFVLRLPYHQKQEFQLFKNTDNLPRQIKAAENSSIFKNKPTILIVEDNADLLNFINDELKENYSTLMTTNGEQALRIIQDKNIHLAVTDIAMPKMDGISLCKNLKERPETSHIPIIILTAQSTIHSEIEGLESGADAYISKPFSMEYLKVQISNLLENRKHILDAYSNSPLSSFKGVPHSEIEQDFMEKLDKIIAENMRNPDLNVDLLAIKMNMSRSTLYRKIKHLSQLSPNDLINNCRLQKAAQLLKSSEKKIYQIAEEVGYSSPSSFSRNFHKRYKMTPTEFI